MPTWTAGRPRNRAPRRPGTTAAAAQAKLQAIAAEIEDELRRAGQPGSVAGLPALLELRPGVPAAEPGSAAEADQAAETSILFAVEPPGTALLIAVLDGGGAIREHRGDAVAAARDVLRQAQSGQDPDLAGHSYPDAAAVLAAFGHRQPDPPADAGTTEVAAVIGCGGGEIRVCAAQ